MTCRGAMSYALLGSARSTLRSALADPEPMCFTTLIASIIVMSKSRTRFAGRYMMLPDIGVGACGNRHPAVLKLLEPIAELPAVLDTDERRFQGVRAFDLHEAFTHALHQAICGSPPRNDSSLQRITVLPSISARTVIGPWGRMAATPA